MEWPRRNRWSLRTAGTKLSCRMRELSAAGGGAGGAAGCWAGEATGWGRRIDDHRVRGGVASPAPARPRAAPARARAGRSSSSVVFCGLAHRLAELTHALAERAGQIGQALGAEHDQRHRGDEDQVYWIVDSHRESSYAPDRPIRSLQEYRHRRADPLRSHIVATEASPPQRSSQAGRPYPPPAADGAVLARPADRARRDRAPAAAPRTADGRTQMAGPGLRGGAADRPVHRHAQRDRGRASPSPADRARR